MTITEMLFRGGQFLQKKLEQKYCKGHKPEANIKEWPIPILKLGNINEYLVEEKFYIFGIPFEYTRTINWQEDIQSGKCFTSTFSKNLNIRNTKNISAKIVWEINRLQFLTIIAIKYKQTKNRKYLNQYCEICENWIENNPYLLGVNWYSNIEVNLRLITWFLSWEILDINEICKTDDRFKLFVEEKLLPTIYLHCEYSYRNPSKFSSANNHFISEYAGLYIASSFWKFKKSEKWKRYSKKGLEKEIIKQHSENGVNKEEAAEYIQFITDFFLLSFIVGKNTGDSFSYKFASKLHEIICYIDDFLDIRGNFPNYGDGDDGKAFILNTNSSNNFKSIVTSGAVLFNDSSLKKSDYFDLKNQILLGTNGARTYRKLTKNKVLNNSSFYIPEGHFIFRKKDNTGKEVYCHFDAAPLGYLSIAAHGHSDCLSFILSIDGNPIFVDSGTYTYHTDFEFRKYFTSTLAHNTVCLDSQNQSIQAGPTLWVKHFEAKVIKCKFNEDIELVKATHNGYERINKRHTRTLQFNKHEEVFIIEDQIDNYNKKECLIELPFHIHPKCEIEVIKNNKIKIISRGTRKVIIYLDSKLEVKIVEGQTEPILGWYSKSFLHKEPTKVIYCTLKSFDSIILKTIIKIIES